MDDLQYEVLIDEARQPRHYGEMTHPDLTLEGVNASCGDSVKVFLKLQDPSDSDSAVHEVSWIGQGCIISQASMSVLADHILTQGLSISQAAAVTQAELEKLVGLEHISTGRIKCLTLGVSTLKSHTP